MSGDQIFSIVLFTVSFCCLIASLYMLLTTRMMKRNTLNQLAAVKKNALNKIANLNPNELDHYLEPIMVMIIKQNISQYTSDKDPAAKEELYARSAVDFLNYLGENVAAVEYHYGTGFLQRWFNNRFKMIVLDRTLENWIENPMYTKAVSSDEAKAAVDEILQNMMGIKKVPVDTKKGGAT